jgi:hypothetical protein
LGFPEWLPGTPQFCSGAEISAGAPTKHQKHRGNDMSTPDDTTDEPTSTPEETKCEQVCPACGSGEDIDRMSLPENNICSDGIYFRCWLCDHEWGDGRD